MAMYMQTRRRSQSNWMPNAEQADCQGNAKIVTRVLERREGEERVPTSVGVGTARGRRAGGSTVLREGPGPGRIVIWDGPHIYKATMQRLTSLLNLLELQDGVIPKGKEWHGERDRSASGAGKMFSIVRMVFNAQNIIYLSGAEMGVYI